MAQLKDTVVSGTLTATTIKRSDNSSNILKGDGTTIALGTASGTVAKGDHTHDDRYYTESEIDKKLDGKSNTGHDHDASAITAGTLGVERGGTGATDLSKVYVGGATNDGSGNNIVSTYATKSSLGDQKTFEWDGSTLNIKDKA